MVAGMVTVGGITRLTKSGLSMTDWKVQGTMPPTTLAQWTVEFERYKLFPEWQQRKSMTLEEFKFIFWWEYGHRMLGRCVGVAFVGPLIYFAARGRLTAQLKPRLALLLGLGASQGFIGWWMVQSGLDVDPQSKKEIRVSPYRLATHLGMAFTTYSLLTWTALDVLRPGATTELSATAMRHGARLRPLAAASAVLVFGTAMSGAFVAGNDAGHAYNTWPMMGDVWIPEGTLSMSPLWRNFFENTPTVQLDHRLLAYATATSVGTLTAVALFAENGKAWATLPLATRRALAAGAFTATAQVGLGVATLLLYVPIPLAATHQFGSLVLLTTMLGAAHSLRFAAPRAIAAAPAMARAALG
ncbi:COX15/CtaA family [Pelagophyceae sp. CCMP2097]|nr:COX15/CtaA family [Pelagophyceae sp. CCMP2097]